MKEQRSEMRLLNIDRNNMAEIINVPYNRRNDFLLCRRGSIVLSMDGNNIELKENDLYIYPVFSETTIVKYSDDFAALSSEADAEAAFVQMHTIPDDGLCLAQIRFVPKVSLQMDVVNEIERLFNYVKERKNIYWEMSELVMKALEQALFFEIVTAYIACIPKSITRQNRVDMIFQNFLIGLHDNFTEHRDVKFYADAQYLTQRHFATQIQSKSGKSPLQWIALFVITKAKHLLDDPRKSIKEIAFELNFADISTFGRYFKRHTGISPSDYRASTSVNRQLH